jgi:Glycosyltransferase family 87
VYLTKERLRLYLGGLLVLQLILCATFFQFARRGEIDFRTFYATGHMLRTGDAIYDYEAEKSAQSALVSPNPTAVPFMYPPYAALLFVPLALGSYMTGYLLFFALNLCFCGLALVIMRPYTTSLEAKWRPLVPVLFLSFMPLGITLMFGQVSLLLLVLYCACFAALQTGRPLLAGIFLSLALIKFQIALPVAFLFLVWRQWRFIAGFLCGTVVLTLISIRITGLKVIETYVESLVFMSRHASNAAGQAKYATFPAQMPNLYGFFHSISHGAPWGFALTILCSLVVLLWAAIQKPSLPVALLAGMLVSYHLFFYDATLLLLPISLLFNQTIDSPIHGRRKAAIYASSFLVLASFWGAFLTFDFHHLAVIPIAVLFACLNPNSLVQPPALRLDHCLESN